MRVDAPGAPHLTYCTNIHPGERWVDVRANLERYVLPVRARVAAGRRFGVGLRISGEAARGLGEPGALADLQAFLQAHDLYVFTLNGFPYGPFHGTPVKEAVYLPDWTDDARLDYSDRLAELLATLLPGDVDEGTVSTVPGGFAPRVASDAQAQAVATRLLRHAERLYRLEAETGKRIVLALEPEPCCFLETVAQTVDFFQTQLFAPDAVSAFAERLGLGRGEGEAFLREHLGVCLDACHMAVEFEDPGAALKALDAAGIRVPKVQVSAGLQALLGDATADQDVVLQALARFADDVYLHQVVERGPDGELRRFLDLPQAIEAARSEIGRAREWRIHFHVPLFREQLGPFRGTQEYVCALLDLLRGRPRPPHLEVETYTWDVLPEEHRREDIVTAVSRELEWTVQRVAGAPT